MLLRSPRGKEPPLKRLSLHSQPIHACRSVSMVTVFLRPPPLSKSSSRPSRIVTRYQPDSDLPPRVSAFVPVLDPVFLEQPPGVDIQLLRQSIRFHVHAKEFAKLRGAAGPLRAFRRDPLCDFLKKRLRGSLPQFRFDSFQIPAKLFFIPKKIQPLILLVSSGDFQGGGV